jgi:hypothetical protein
VPVGVLTVSVIKLSFSAASSAGLSECCVE